MLTSTNFFWMTEFTFLGKLILIGNYYTVKECLTSRGKSHDGMDSLCYFK